jgi:formiminotetrahydrofolate cyclodeaminase
MSQLDNLTISDFAAELGSDNPAPGGGSTAALAGVLACSLAGMVAKITLKHSEDPEVMSKLKEIITETDSIGNQFQKLINDDTEAFNDIMSSFKLPKDTESEKQIRSESIQTAIKHAAEVPLKTAQLGLHALSWVKTLTEIGLENAITDTGVAGLMAYSTINGGVWNVKINLGLIRDSEFVQETNLKLEKITQTTETQWVDIQSVVEAKIKR